MRFTRSLNVVNVHCGGEIGDVIIGGVLDVPGTTMFDKMMHFWAKQDHIRNMLLNEPRGRAAKNVNLVLPPCDPQADAGFLIMESEEYVAMSGSNTICTVTALLETGMLPMVEPVTRVKLDSAAGLVPAVAECENGKCKTVAFDNVPAFVFELDFEVDVPGLGKVALDIAWGGMVYIMTDAAKLGVSLTRENGKELVDLGEKIKRAAMDKITPIHPTNPSIRGISNLIWTGPLEDDTDGGIKSIAATVVLPGRLDRSPCGTGTSARIAVLHKRGLLKDGQIFRHISVIGTEFFGHVRGRAKAGEYDAVLPTIKGSAWITGFTQVVLDPTDPFPEGFRCGDSWHEPPKNGGPAKLMLEEYKNRNGI